MVEDSSYAEVLKNKNNSSNNNDDNKTSDCQVQWTLPCLAVHALDSKAIWSWGR